MEIRWLKVEEIGKLITLLTKGFPIDTTEEKVKKNLNEKNLVLVAVEEGKIIGSVLIKTEENFMENLISFHLHNIYVEKSRQNQGIGSKILRQVEVIAKSENIDYIDLTSSNYRVAAHHLYAKNNYDKRESCLFRKRISNKEF